MRIVLRLVVRSESLLIFKDIDHVPLHKWTAGFRATAKFPGMFEIGFDKPTLGATLRPIAVSPVHFGFRDGFVLSDFHAHIKIVVQFVEEFPFRDLMVFEIRISLPSHRSKLHIKAFFCDDGQERGRALLANREAGSIPKLSPALLAR